MKQRSLIFFTLSFISAVVMVIATPVISQEIPTSTNINLRTFTPKGETTNVSEPTQTKNVAATGEARCPPNTILVGFDIADNAAAYQSIRGTHLTEKCGGLEVKADNKTSRLVVDPTKFTYTLICRPVGLDFY